MHQNFRESPRIYVQNRQLTNNGKKFTTSKDSNLVKKSNESNKNNFNESELIQPKKVVGTPTMYAHLQFPTSSNYGSMKRRRSWERESERRRSQEREAGRRRSRERETDYVRIKFNPEGAERAEL